MSNREQYIKAAHALDLALSAIHVAIMGLDHEDRPKAVFSFGAAMDLGSEEAAAGMLRWMQACMEHQIAERREHGEDYRNN